MAARSPNLSCFWDYFVNQSAPTDSISPERLLGEKVVGVIVLDVALWRDVETETSIGCLCFLKLRLRHHRPTAFVHPRQRDELATAHRSIKPHGTNTQNTEEMSKCNNNNKVQDYTSYPCFHVYRNSPLGVNFWGSGIKVDAVQVED